MAPMADPARQLILASGSSTRRMMLLNAGVHFQVLPSTVDENRVRNELLARDPGTTPAQIAQSLAIAKAEQVSRQHPEAIVIGADQTLSLDGSLVNKAPDLAAARARLLELRGRQHMLHSAVAVAGRGSTSYTFCDTARLVVRPFSAKFLDGYIAAAGERILYSVGAYEIEGLGVQLFEVIDGDYFTILGLPLLPLLSELRSCGVVPS